jgi:serine/threonine/tyrosine-interacting protein
LKLEKYHGFEYETEEEREILIALTQGNHVAVSFQEWKYEWRRAAQSILSFLYLGPSSAARDVDALRREGITLLLVIRNTMMAGMLSGERVANSLGIEHASIDVAGNQQLIQAFPTARQSTTIWFLSSVEMLHLD